MQLRKDKNRRYTGKKQKQRMKQLTYHHIIEKRNGGQATIENGALLSAENHMWFNKQNEAVQNKLNDIFQTYKKTINIAIIQGEEIETKNIEFDFSDYITIPLEDSNKYNRTKEKREWHKEVKDYIEEK